MRVLTQKEFLEKAIKTHGSRYDYSRTIYKNTDKKVCIICLEHGEFWQTPNKHTNGGRGCPKCAGNVRFSKEEFIKRAVKIHGYKYNYDEVEYKNARTKVKIFCKICNKYFMQIPVDHLRSKYGCSVCSRVERGKIGRDSYEKFVKKARIIHGAKYKYFEYTKSSEKVRIECNKCGNIFYQTPNGHVSGRGCSICTLSRGENLVSNFLENNEIDFIHQKSFVDCINPKTGYHLKFDFYLPEHNLLIEYDGIQHFEPIECFGGKKDFLFRKFKDKVKNNYAKENNINLLRLNDFNDVNEKILEEIKNV